jgi:hypothetical protein
MALNGDTHMQKTAFYRLDLFHTPCRQRCGRWIIHVFLIFLSQAVPTTIFGLAVGFFAFFGLPISSLGLAMIFSSAAEPTLIAAVGLAPEATPANTKRQIAPSTSELKQ